MNVGLCYEGNIKGEFIFSPLFEMLASMHVITRPEHHLDRMKWMDNIVKETPDKIINEIREVGLFTNEWLIIMGFSSLNYYADFDIPEAIHELEKLSLSNWNKVFKFYNKSIQKNDKSKILTIMKEYYELIFKNEINFLQPYLIRVLKKEIEACQEDGLLKRVNRLHERIEVKGTEIILHKNKEYHFDAAKLDKIVIRASTFMSPHLLMGDEKGLLYLTKLVEVEEKKDKVPLDLVNLFKALGDETRLKILHEMRRDPASTQSLAIKLCITEAGISKHLKILYNAGLIEKKRQGNYILYFMSKNAIDYIPYKLYEYIMR